jgi:hypothetical protein
MPIKRPVKVAALVLATLAAAKIGTVDYLGRTATRDAMVIAFSTQAIEACERAKPIAGLTAAIAPWSRPHDVQMQIGDRSVSVALWQVDHTNWAHRYRRAYLVLIAGSPAAPERCTFDVANGTATVAS